MNVNIGKKKRKKKGTKERKCFNSSSLNEFFDGKENKKNSISRIEHREYL